MFDFVWLRKTGSTSKMPAKIYSSWQQLPHAARTCFSPFSSREDSNYKRLLQGRWPSCVPRSWRWCCWWPDETGWHELSRLCGRRCSTRLDVWFRRSIFKFRRCNSFRDLMLLNRKWTDIWFVCETFYICLYDPCLRRWRQFVWRVWLWKSTISTVWKAKSVDGISQAESAIPPRTRRTFLRRKILDKLGVLGICRVYLFWEQVKSPNDKLIFWTKTTWLELQIARARWPATI